MILSDEPGFYAAGGRVDGIRLENLLLVGARRIVQRVNRPFLAFETLDARAVRSCADRPALLTVAERDWLNAYDARGMAGGRTAVDAGHGDLAARRLRSPCEGGRQGQKKEGGPVPSTLRSTPMGARIGGVLSPEAFAASIAAPPSAPWLCARRAVASWPTDGLGAVAPLRSCPMRGIGRWCGAMMLPASVSLLVYGLLGDVARLRSLRAEYMQPWAAHRFGRQVPLLGGRSCACEIGVRQCRATAGGILATCAGAGDCPQQGGLEALAALLDPAAQGAALGPGRCSRPSMAVRSPMWWSRPRPRWRLPPGGGRGC